MAQSRILCLAAAAAMAVLAGCGGEPGAGNPDSALTSAEAAAPLADAPAALAALRADSNRILDEGQSGFEARLAELRGHPVVVNKWASWCGPCREEFPYFQSQAIEHGADVAFLGLLSNDGEETGRSFLDRLPLPYPSYLDPDLEIANGLRAGREFPATVFLDSAGEVVYTRRGPYADEAELAADIERHAGG